MFDVSWSWPLVLEVASVALGLGYVVLAARPHPACWPLGIAGSALGVILFVDARLYSEALLQVVYVVLGVVGWLSWTGQPDGRPIARWPLRRHLVGVGVALVGTAVLGGAMGALTDAALPLVDAFTTSFSLLATWMVARKVLENWAYWVVIDAVTAGLYASRGLYVYAGLMVVYTVVAAVGLWRWWRVARDEASRPPVARAA